MDAPDLTIDRLGEGRLRSPLEGFRFVRPEERILLHNKPADLVPFHESGEAPPSFELAGPRERVFFDPAKVRAGIVTCGGLCPGLNDVIRAIVLSLHHHYGVTGVEGFRYGYEGLVPGVGEEPMRLDLQTVSEIHGLGGTILGSSRGPQDVRVMVDNLVARGIGILFTIGGDGTLRGARAISEEAARRGVELAVVGVPKTIDNDIYYVKSSFGFETAVTESRDVIYGASREALGARNGVGLVKLMGRHSGFIAAYATLASGRVHCCLVPEIDFSLDGLMAALRARLEEKNHAVIVVGEGAGQDLLASEGGRDASGNLKLGDIGVYLRDRIREHFREAGVPVDVKYIDPSYTIRSLPSNARDSAFCLLLGQNAVHAAMAGRTNLVVGFWSHEFTHVPIPAATSQRKQIDPQSRLWNAVLMTTGQNTGSHFR